MEPIQNYLKVRQRANIATDFTGKHTVVTGMQTSNKQSHQHTALFPVLPEWAGTRKVKSNWILLKQDSEWQWHTLGHMQACTSLQTDNHAGTTLLSFLQAGCPSCHPTNSIKALKIVNKFTKVVLKQF